VHSDKNAIKKVRAIKKETESSPCRKSAIKKETESSPCRKSHVDFAMLNFAVGRYSRIISARLLSSAFKIISYFPMLSAVRAKLSFSREQYWLYSWNLHLTVEDNSVYHVSLSYSRRWATIVKIDMNINAINTNIK